MSIEENVVVRGCKVRVRNGYLVERQAQFVADIQIGRGKTY